MKWCRPENRKQEKKQIRQLQAKEMVQTRKPQASKQINKQESKIAKQESGNRKKEQANQRNNPTVTN